MKTTNVDLKKGVMDCWSEEDFFDTPATSVHPTAIVGKNVILGQGVKVGPFCTIVGSVTIGDRTRIYPYVSIGFPGQVIGLKDSLGRIEIGQDCHIREFVTIHGARSQEGFTKIGNNCYLMNFAHVSHDCFLEDNVTLINNVALGGHTHVENKAIVMAGAMTHQFCRVGQYAALAPCGGTRQDLPPFCLFNSQPAHFYGLNVIGLKRAGFTSQDIHALKHLTKLFYQEKLPINQIQLLAQQEPDWGSVACVEQFLSFVTNSKRGVSRRAAVDNKKEEKNNEESSW